MTIANDEQQRHGLTMGLGIGINRGPVVMGNVGSDQFLSFIITGDTVNVAARIQAPSEPGTVAVTDAVWRAAPAPMAGRECRPLEPVALKGKAQPLALHRLAA